MVANSPKGRTRRFCASCCSSQGNVLSKLCIAAKCVPEGVKDYVNNPNSFGCHFLNQQRVRANRVLLKLGVIKPLETRERIVILGSGWSSLYFLKSIDPRKFHVTVVSPKSLFSFSPLLNLCATGVLTPGGVTVGFRKLVQHIRRGPPVPLVDVVTANAESIDTHNNMVNCKDPKNGNGFSLPYDKLVVAVGAETNTFGIPGVEENSIYLKSVEDAVAIKRKLIENLDRANLPSTRGGEKKRLLSVVIVGGGAAGTESAGAIQELINKEIKTHYPELADYAQVTVVEMLPRLMPAFTPKSSEIILKNFGKIGVKVMLQTKVTRVGPNFVSIVDASNKEEQLPHGMVIWASGIKSVPFSEALNKSIKEQAGNRVTKVDETLKVIGSDNIFGMGDCCMVSPTKLSAMSDILYEKLKSFGLHHPDMKRYPQLHSTQWSDRLKLPKSPTKSQFETFLKIADETYKAPAPTGQMARQAGVYLACAFNSAHAAAAKKTLPFTPKFIGDMADIGNRTAILEIPKGRNCFKCDKYAMSNRYGLYWMRRMYYWSSIQSTNTMFRQFIDYVTTELWGRSIDTPYS